MLRNMTVLGLIFFGSVGCDQVTKDAATKLLAGQTAQSFWGDTFRLLYTENTGAFLGLGANWPPALRWGLFTLLSLLAVVAALVWVVRQVARTRSLHPYGVSIGVTLLVAGGMGNLVDRVLRDGAVIDFMNLGIGSLRTGIFNVADVQIMLGLALWLLSKTPEREHSHAAPL